MAHRENPALWHCGKEVLFLYHSTAPCDPPHLSKFHLNPVSLLYSNLIRMHWLTGWNKSNVTWVPKMGLSPDMQRTKCTRGLERGCICPLPSVPHKHIPFLVSRPTSTRKNSRGKLVQVILFWFFFSSLDTKICLKHWTLDMWVSVGWFRAGLYQWLSLLLLCFLIQTSAALRVWSSWRHNENRGLLVENLYDLLPKTFEVSNFRNWFSVSLTYFCFFSQHKEVASLGFCFKAS